MLFDLKNNCLNRLEYSGLYISFTEDSDCKVLYPYSGYVIDISLRAQGI